MLKGKTAIITGADKGLGKHTAGLFIQNGATVVICSRNHDMLKRAAEEINSERLFICKADVSDREETDRLFAFALDKMGSLDILVNNAGIQGPIGRFDETEWEEWQNVFSVNLFGAAYCMKKAIEIFKKQGHGGKIISLSGGGATSSRPNFSGYAAAKCSLVRLTEILADENRDFGIDINSIAPGVMNTDMLKSITEAGELRSGEKEYRIAAGQIEGDLTSLVKPAQLIEFLASDTSDGITGKLISAVWDDWDKDTFIEKCSDKNIYTLRRTTE